MKIEGQRESTVIAITLSTIVIVARIFFSLLLGLVKNLAQLLYFIITKYVTAQQPTAGISISSPLDRTASHSDIPWECESSGVLRGLLSLRDAFADQELDWRSPAMDFANISWNFDAQCPAEGERMVSLSLLCNADSASTLWSVRVAGRLTVSPQQATAHSIEQEFSFDFEKSAFSCMMLSLPLDDFASENEEEVTLRIEASLTLSRVIGICRPLVIDFSRPQSIATDGVLLIAGVPLYVSKQWLSLHSPYFAALFYAGFSESSQAEIVLQEVDGADFLALLSVIYPGPSKISVGNVSAVLRLADMFSMEFVRAECSKFIVGSEKMKMPAKLALADQYRLAEVQESVLARLCSGEAVRELMQGYDYQKNFSPSTKVALLEKMATLIDKGLLSGSVIDLAQAGFSLRRT